MDRLDFGYCIQSPVLSGDECDTLLGTMGNYRTTGRAGTRHTMSIEGVTELANDSLKLAIHVYIEEFYRADAAENGEPDPSTSRNGG